VLKQNRLRLFLKVLLCINKCGPVVSQITKEFNEIQKQPLNEEDEDWVKCFKQRKTAMEEALAQRFADKLNSYYKKKDSSARLDAY
jgi:hypothetical protein